MIIFIRGKRTFAAVFEPSDTVLAVKQFLEEYEEVPVTNLGLTYMGRAMNNSRMLSDYLLKENSAIEYRVVVTPSRCSLA